MSHMALFNMTQHHGPHDPSPWSLLWAHQRSWKSSSLRDCSLPGDSEMPLPSHLTYLTIAALQLLLKRWKAHLDSLIQTQLFQDHSMLFTFNRSNQGFACFPCTFYFTSSRARKRLHSLHEQHLLQRCETATAADISVKFSPRSFLSSLGNINWSHWVATDNFSKKILKLIASILTLLKN